MRWLAVLLPAVLCGGQTEVARVDQLFAEYKATPGCAVGVLRNGKVAMAKGYGLANLEYRQPLGPQSAFYMASVSKQFMAMAILLLAEEGKLSLDDSVRQYVPEMPAYAEAITIRHLLHHTSGLRDYLGLGALAGYSADHVWTDYAARRMIARQKALNFAPGSEYLYSNSGYVMLSWIAEKVTGRRLNDWSQERIFGPLGMKNTRWQQNHSDFVPMRATGHVKAGDTWRIANSMLDVVGDGGLYSTVEDMLKWAANFESPKVGAKALELMQTPGRLANGSEIGFGYGMGLARGRYRGLTTISHAGALAGHRTSFQRIPEKRLATVVLCNNGSGNAARLGERVAEAWLDLEVAASEPVKPAVASSAEAVAAGDAAGLVGEYFSEELGSVARVVRDGDRLLFSVADLPGSVLMKSEKGFAIGTTGVMVRVADGVLLVDMGRVRGVEFRRR
jgi:CubicO group peptidase (beta-lactamase class C family)